MKPELILRSDILDILFENRNKSYGAYYLRKHYNSHLMAGLTGMVIFSIAIWIFSHGNGGDNKIYSAFPYVVSDTIKLTGLVDNFHENPPKPSSPPKKAIANPKSLSYVIGPDLARLDEPDQPSPDQGTEKADTQTGEAGNGERTGSADNVSQKAIPAPVPAPEEVEPEIYLSPAVMPQFPGGEAALHRWLSKQLRPGDELLPGQKVKVLVRFVVNQSGNIDRIELLQAGGDPYDKEVLRVINKMPRWEPGRQNGHTVAAWFLVPIIFEMPEQ